MIKKILTGNILTKLMAVVMAVALWLYAINRYTGDSTGMIGLTVSVSEGITILEQSTEEITVHFRGPQNIIYNVESLIKDNKIHARYVIQEYPSGIEDQIKQTIPITRSHINNLPKDVKIVSIYPDKVDILLGKLQKKRLKVNLQKKGEPAVGYIIANEFVFPREIEVAGPLNILKETSYVNTIPIDIGGLTEDQNRTFPWRIGIDQKILIKRGDKVVSVPVTCNEDVRVWLQIVEQQDTKLFEKIKIKVLRPVGYPYTINLDDEFSNVKVKGPRLLLDKLSSEDVMLYIDVTSLKPPGPYKLPIKCILPKNVELVDKLPEIHLDIK